MSIFNMCMYAILNVCMYVSIYALQELIREVEATRLKLAQDFYARLKKNKSIVAALKPRRVALRDGYDSDDDRNYKIEIIVSVIKYSLSLLTAMTLYPIIVYQAEKTVLSSKDQIIQWSAEENIGAIVSITVAYTNSDGVD